MSTQTTPATEPELRPVRTRERVLLAPIHDMQVRTPDVSGDGSLIVEGYAAVFEQPTTLYNGRDFSLREIISRGAFSRCLQDSPTVHLNIGHDMNRVMASTAVQGVGGLKLTEDMHGLHFEARVSPKVSYASDAAELMRMGVINQASFAFTIDDEEIDEEGEDADGRSFARYRINSVGNLYDVCVAAQGAYPQTESAVRSLFGAHFGRLAEAEGHRGRSQEGPTPVAATEQGSPVTETQPADTRSRFALEYERARLMYPKEQK